MKCKTILLLSAGLMAGLMIQCAAGNWISATLRASVVKLTKLNVLAFLDRDGATTGSAALQRFRRTIGSGTSFVNCLEIGGSRFCSYDHALLEAIERAGPAVRGGCPEGRVFRHRCNVCECKRDGSALACSTDLCAEDFYDAGTGLPKLWWTSHEGNKLDGN